MGEEVKKKINPNHQMLFTAPDGWGYFWAGALFVVQLAKSLVKNALTPEWEKRSKKKKNRNHQMLFTAPDSWGYFLAGA